MSNEIVVVQVGIQGPVGAKGDAGVGYKQFDTLAELLATTGSPGDIAYALDDTDDNHYKWSKLTNTWRVVF